MTTLRSLAAWCGVGQSVIAVAANTQATAHHCGGTLGFYRDANASIESCSGCDWRYDFELGRASGVSGLLTPAPGETNAPSVAS